MPVIPNKIITLVFDEQEVEELFIHKLGSSSENWLAERTPKTAPWPSSVQWNTKVAILFVKSGDLLWKI